MKNDLISVVIPAFNSERYLRKCINSVLDQTYKNLEIIIVNDGSTDKTGEIALQYNNVVLLNKENGGLCSARNYGVKHAKGKYVVLLDSDDYLEKDFIKKLYENTSGKNDEIVMCDFLLEGKKENDNYQFLKVEGRESIYNLYLHGGIYNRTVNKLYPAEMIKLVPFCDGRDMLEDAYFTSHILEHCNFIVRIPYAGYNYVRHKGSLTKRRHNKYGTAGKYTNLLEKDILLSKYISKAEYDYFAQKTFNNITNAFNANIDLSIYDIYIKMLLLIDFLYKNRRFISNDKVSYFSEHMIKAKTIKQLKKRFMSFVLVKGSFSDKYIFMRSNIRKLIKNY